ncbi:hypothetical protein GW17_00022560 [Ensete ventricosum]|nr:hypothetical protein GW17_00022560 [Ensete ventricosum]
MRGGQPQPAPMQGRPPTTRSAARGSRLRPRPPARGRPIMVKAPCRGSRQHAWPPAGIAGACRGGAYGRRQRPRPGRRGRLPAARPQGATPRPGLSPARAAAPVGAALALGGTARP